MPEILSPMEAAPPSLPPPAPPAKDAPGPAEAAPAASEVGNPSSPDAAALPVQAGKGAVVAAPPPPKSSPLVKLLARGTPTNYNMLTFRVLNRLQKKANANDDDLALLFHTKLMPARTKWFQLWPLAMTRYRQVVELGAPGAINFVDARTKWFDAHLQAALDEGIQQVVILAAGFDTRAYRFQREGVRFFEVDLPAASQRKRKLVEKVLQQATKPVFIGADLGKVPLDEALASAPGFDPTQRTFVSVEGLVYYLEPAAVEALVGKIAGLVAAGSRLVFDFMQAAALDGREERAGFKVTAAAVANKGEPFVSGIEDSEEGLAALLQPAGFKVLQRLGPRAMAEAQLPHLPWNDAKPPIASFYSYCAAEKC